MLNHPLTHQLMAQRSRFRLQQQNPVQSGQGRLLLNLSLQRFPSQIQIFQIHKGDRVRVFAVAGRLDRPKHLIRRHTIQTPTPSPHLRTNQQLLAGIRIHQQQPFLAQKRPLLHLIRQRLALQGH